MTTQPVGIFEALIASLNANTAAKNRNNDLLERVIAGQQAALDKIEAPKTPGNRKKAETSAATEAKSPETPAASTESTPPETQTARVVTDDEIRAAAGAWSNGKTVEQRTEDAKKMASILDHFGLAGTKIIGPESKLDGEQKKQALFFIQRWGAGLTVDFSADYDFDGDPTQGAAEPVNDPLG